MADLLEVDHLTVRYGGLAAVEDVSLRVPKGRLVGLIGPNGAGKTTLVDALSGFTSSSGSVRLAGRSIESMKPHQRAHLGLARTFQSLELFEDLTVRENLLVAAERPRWWTAVLDAARPSSSKAVAAADWALEAVGMSAAADRLPGSLSHGQRKVVAVARALASRPSCLLLDEPAAGLDTTESQILGSQLQTICEHGISILLVDHDMGLILGVCDYLYVIEFGKLIAEGPPSVVRRDPAVIRAYLGASAEAAGEIVGDDHSGAGGDAAAKTAPTSDGTGASGTVGSVVAP